MARDQIVIGVFSKNALSSQKMLKKLYVQCSNWSIRFAAASQFSDIPLKLEEKNVGMKKELQRFSNEKQNRLQPAKLHAHRVEPPGILHYRTIPPPGNSSIFEMNILVSLDHYQSN